MPPALEKILLVDDIPENLSVLSQNLSSQNFEILVAMEGEKAITLARRDKPSLILLDIKMPGLDGFEVCRRLKAHKDTADIPIIFLSALSDVDDKVAGLELGAVDYITKPFQSAEVIARVNTHLAIRRLTRELAVANQRMKADLNSARKVQKSLLPDDFENPEGYRFAFCYESCDELGGDSLGIDYLDDQHIAAYVLDVSDHGVKPALLAVSVTHALSPSSKPGSLAYHPAMFRTKIASPVEVAARLNERYPFDEENGMYFTMIYGILDLKKHQLRFTAAGHPSPIHATAEGRLDSFPSHGLPIGLMEDSSYKEESITLQPGERLFFFSDGLHEQRNLAKQQLLRSRVEHEVIRTRHLPLQESVESLKELALNWHEHRRMMDDLSILAIERLPETE